VRRTESEEPARDVALSPDDGTAIDLRRPAVAALLAWLVPGLGHLYQGRTAKGWLFMAVLLGTFVVGFWIGGGRVVYASWKPGEKRWAFICQAGIGVAAIPALVQSVSLGGGEPFLPGGFMAPPLSRGQPVTRGYASRLIAADPAIDAADFLPLRGGDAVVFRPYPPQGMPDRRPADQLSIWHERLGRFFEIGTLYTMLAGMLNVLVVYDAWSGPLHDPRREPEAGGKPPAEPRP